MDTASIPIPGTLRLRPLQPVVDADGACRRVFDLERAAEVEVPQELRLHVAAALESGDFDEDLLSWLVSEDLITSEGWHPAPAPCVEAAAARGRCRVDGELHVRLDLRAERGLGAALDQAFAEAAGGERLVLHLCSGGPFPSASSLERVVVEAEQRVYGSGLQVFYELALAPSAVSAGIVRFLAATPLQLRLACEIAWSPRRVAPLRRGGELSQRAWAAAEAAAALVLDGIPDRLTFQAVLGPGVRLRDVCRWARARGILHLDVLVLGTHPGDTEAAAADDYRRDLLAAAEEFARDLARERPPLDLQPLTGIARRLLRLAASPDDPYRLRGRHATAHGRFADGAAAIFAPRASLAAAPSPAPSGASRCADCWAQRACGASTLLAEAAAGAEGWGPSPRRCALRRAEAEAARLLVARLAGPPAAFARRVLEEMGRTPLDPLAHASWAGEAPASA